MSSTHNSLNLKPIGNSSQKLISDGGINWAKKTVISLWLHIPTSSRASKYLIVMEDGITNFYLFSMDSRMLRTSMTVLASDFGVKRLIKKLAK